MALQPVARLRFNKARAYDPTGTTSIRQSFIREINRRFHRLIAAIREEVVDNDGLALEPLRTNAVRRQFDFAHSSDKVQHFMSWLDEQADKQLLTYTRKAGRKVAAEKAWTSVYIQSAYQNNMARAINEMKKAGLDPYQVAGIQGPFQSRDQLVRAAFLQPVHADRVGLIYTRTYEDLKNVTEAMSGKISAVLAQGIAEGLGPEQMARNMVKQVEDIGKVRARMIARTEVVRAANVASINTYREAGVMGVTVKAEWSTAGDGDVCDDCAALEGKVYELDVIEGMIPLHCNCRCAAIPWLGDDHPDKQVDDEEAAALPPDEEPPALPANDEIAAQAISDKTITMSPQDVAAGYSIQYVLPSFDKAFSREDGYIGPMGDGQQDERYTRFGRYFHGHKSIQASSVTVWEDGTVRFTNGRHRYAYMRDLRQGKVPVAMDKKSVRNAKAHKYISSIAEEQK